MSRLIVARWAAISLFIGLIAIGVVGYSAITHSEPGFGQRVMATITATGLTTALVATSIGVFALAFLGGARRRVVVPFAIALVVIVNLAVYQVLNERSHYQTQPGTARDSLVQIAVGSPNRNVSSELATVFALGARLGDAHLVVPSGVFGSRIRAFTDIQVSVLNTSGVSASHLPWRNEDVIGTIGEFEIRVFGSSDSYVWVDVGEGSVVILPEGLVSGSVPETSHGG